MTKKCLLDGKVVCRKLTDFGPPNIARILQGPSLYAYQEILLATWAGCSVPQPLWLCWEKLKLSQTKTKPRSCRFAGWKTETVFLKNIEKKSHTHRLKEFFGFFVWGVPFFHSCVFSTSWLLFSSTEFVSTLDCLFVNFRIFSAAFWRAEKTGSIQLYQKQADPPIIWTWLPIYRQVQCLYLHP